MKINPQKLLIVTCGTAITLLASCSDKPANTNSVSIDKSPEASVSVEPQMSRLESAKEALLEGKVISLDFNNCPFDDSEWEGAKDPLGGIQCGSVYKVSFNSDTGEWTGVGFDEYRFATTGETVMKNYVYPYPAPRSGAVSLWGGTFILFEDGQLAMPRTSTDPQRMIGTYTF